MSRRRLALATLAITAISASNYAVAKSECEKPGVQVEAKVMATPDIAYEAIRSMRDESPDGCRVISKSVDECVVEEIFDGLPIIGAATCIYRETYEPGKSVSFKMISSNKLKAFEGEWTLQAIDNGQHTLLRLRSYIDTGLKVPFAKQLTQAASANEIRDHLTEVKKSAEKKQAHVAEKCKSPTL